VVVLVAVLDYFDKVSRNCMWRNTDINTKNKTMVAWKKCTKPKRKGGLGIINLRSQNNALLLKHLDKFYNKKEVPWVKLIWNAHYSNGEVSHASKNKGSFWWRDVMKLVDLFRGIASCKIGDGSTVLFWMDVWNDHLLHNEFPRLLSFAENKKISVAQFLSNNNIELKFHLPLCISRIPEFAVDYTTNPNNRASQR
jgi:hypothetical protein